MLNRKEWKRRIAYILSLDSHPGHISAGLAVGIFIGITPFFGIHTVMAVVAAFLFRLNKVTCITGAWLNTPLTILPLLGLSYKTGRVLRGLPPQELQVKGLDWAELKMHAGSLLLGSSVIGFVIALGSYFLSYWLIVRFRRKDDALQLITREIEEVGEEIEP